MTRLRREFSAVWALPAARRGLWGLLLIAIGSFTPAFLPESTPWSPVAHSLGLDSIVGRALGTAGILLGIGLLVDAWYRLRPATGDVFSYRMLLALWSLPFLLAPPIFSHDAYSYAAQGWLVHNGVDPYQVGPGALPGEFADAVARVWLYTPAPYGPLSLQLQHLLVDAVGQHPYMSAVMMRLPALIGVILIAVFLPGVLRYVGVPQRQGVWFVVVNPLLILDFVGGAHNDSLMIGLVVYALWLATKHQFYLAAVVVGVSTAIKQPGGLAGVAIAVMAVPAAQRTWQNWRAMAKGFGLVGGVSLATFVGVSLATGLNFGWLNAVNVPGMVITMAPTTLLGDIVKLALMGTGYYEYTGLITRTFRIIGMVATAGIIGAMFVKILPRKPLRFTSWAYLAFALGGPALHGWYMLWGGVLLPLSEPNRALRRAGMWGTVGLSFYAGINAAVRNGNITLGVLAAIAATFLVMWHERAVGTPPADKKTAACERAGSESAVD